MQDHYRVDLRNISMYFGSLKANDNINLRVKKQEIHGLIGENGAGKSTLMSILFGLLDQTSGSIILNGEIVNIKDPNDANKYGIGMVHQHFQLIEDFTVLQNIVLGNEKGIPGFVSLEESRTLVENIIEQYGFKVDLDKYIYSCTVAEQQKVEILKMLYLNADVLIFDEPSAVLIPSEIDNLLKSLVKLRDLGKTIILITHKLNEIKAICDTATIIRKGQVVEEVDVKTTSTKHLAASMVGRNVIETKNTGKKGLDEIALDIKDVSSHKSGNPKIKGLSEFSVKAKYGEILAFAGVEGNGQTELFEILLGLHKPSNKSAEISFYKKDSSKTLNLLNLSIGKRYNAGIGYVPLDRHRDAAIDDFSVKNNLSLNSFQKRPFSYLGILNKRRIQNFGKDLIERYDVRGVNPSLTNSFSSLSGGNQQKAVVGREMIKEHDLLVLFQPTRGLDVGAIQHIHKLILNEKEKGKCILLISFELDEILALADRVVAMSEGQNKGILDKESLTREKIGELIAGHE